MTRPTTPTSPPTTFTYQPDHATKPGDLIQEYLDYHDMSARELARRCGRSAKLITEIILGKATVEPETALQLARVLRVDASIWLDLESNYRLNLARQREQEQMLASIGWARDFPVKELSAGGWINDGKGAELVRQLLCFFGAGSVAAYESRFEDLLAANFRTSPAYDNHLGSLAAWLRIGELEAERINPDEFDRDTFRKTLHHIKPLTRKSIADALPELTDLCAKAGVAFVFQPALGKIATSGASRWLSPRRALILQTGRYKRDDHFWFTFYHECAHLLLHSRKQVYVDVFAGQGSATEEEEAQANAWAADFLIPSADLGRFVRTFDGDEQRVVDFAARMGVSPGIVVGQLQHSGVVKFSQMNDLRQPFDAERLMEAAN